MRHNEKIDKLLEETKDLNWQDKLKYVAQHYDNVTFSTSFSIEDQAILHYIFSNDLNIDVFAIDTGRLPTETYTLWSEVLEKYGKKIRALYPDAHQIARFVEIHGINSFYESVDFRHQCCHIRKVEPLQRAIKNKEIWISGIRKEHTVNRQDKDFFEFDNGLNIVKFYPILELTEQQVWDYVKNNDIPYSKLYEKGYKSIGCAPCTRAVEEGEDPRAGRWWWENGDQECGLHVVDGKLVRKNDNNKKDVF